MDRPRKQRRAAQPAQAWPSGRTSPGAGQFLRGVLDKVGVEPQVQRIGKFKSAGDQLLRTDMAPEQRQQLQALLDSVYDGFVGSVARSRGKSEAEARPLTPCSTFVYLACSMLRVGLDLVHCAGPCIAFACSQALVQQGAAGRARGLGHGRPDHQLLRTRQHSSWKDWLPWTSVTTWP